MAAAVIIVSLSDQTLTVYQGLFPGGRSSGFMWINRQKKLHDLSTSQGYKAGEKGFESGPSSSRAGHS